MKKITIAPNIKLKIQPADNATTEDIDRNLPVESKAMTWGDEIYFDTGIQASAEGATLDVAVGDIAYWPQGKCLCIFFGPTPASSGKKPVPASGVVIVGKAEMDPDQLRTVKSGTKIQAE
jgi:hypothetical protein